MSPAGKNLLLRVASALVLLPVVLGLVWLGGLPFAVLIGVAAALAAYEMVAIALFSAPLPIRATVIAGAGAVPLLLGLGGADLAAEAILAGLVLLVILVWLLNLLLPGEDLGQVPGRVGLGVLAVIYTGGLLAPLILLRAHPAGVWWIVLILAVTFLNDTGAYFAGRAFGRAKLYPRVSPAKTWAGFVGGAVAGLGGSLGVVALSHAITIGGVVPLPMGLLAAAILGPLVAAIASAGDLCESLLKRAFEVKDSGKLIPGHGGMLDRIDALLFTAPVVWLWSLFA